jgi:hypothetical protein
VAAVPSRLSPTPLIITKKKNKQLNLHWERTHFSMNRLSNRHTLASVLSVLFTVTVFMCLNVKYVWRSSMQEVSFLSPWACDLVYVPPGYFVRVFMTCTHTFAVLQHLDVAFSSSSTLYRMFVAVMPNAVNKKSHNIVYSLVLLFQCSDTNFYCNGKTSSLHQLELGLDFHNTCLCLWTLRSDKEHRKHMDVGFL